MPYQFKVGDTGKCRDGIRDYTIVATEVKYLNKNRPIIAVINGVTACRFSDGRLYEEVDTAADLIPPKTFVWQVACSVRHTGSAAGELGDETVFISVFKTEKQAEARKKELLGYYKNAIITPLEREQA